MTQTTERLTAPSVSASLHPSSVLTELAGVRAFVIYRLVPQSDGSLDKIPTSPYTGNPCNPHDPAEWMTPEEASMWAEQFGVGYGVGVVISEQIVLPNGLRLFCLDLDKCRDGNQWLPHAASFCARFTGALVECSVSTNGLHVYGCYRGERPDHGVKNKTYRMELYTRLRFIAVTGVGAIGSALLDCTEALHRLAREFFPPHDEIEYGDTLTETPVAEWAGPTDDDELIRRAMRSTSARAVFGGKASFADLFTGNAAVLARVFPPFKNTTWDESSADLALANHLSFWTGNHGTRIEQLMRASKLVREKWNDRPGYLVGTINRACGSQKQWYKEPHASNALVEAPTTEIDVNLAALAPTVSKEILAASSDVLFLPNDYVTAPVAASRIFGTLGDARELFRRGSAVVELDASGQISIITPTTFRSRLNRRGRKVRAFKVDAHGGLVHGPKQCSDDSARMLLGTLEVERLPEIRLVTRMPILVELEGRLHTTTPGYNAECGVLVANDVAVPTVELTEAAGALCALLHDFQFADAGDNARALASLVAPALRMSRLVRDGEADALVTAVEADQSQTGKGYLLRVVRAIYGERAYTVTLKKGGVGSFDESLGQGILSGVPFVFFDNLRGTLNSQYLESVITAGSDPVSVRVPHRGEVQVDTKCTSFQLTSNGVSGTVDLSNRLLLIRLRKQPPGYEFTRFAEGNLLQHIEARGAFYLGCVHALIRHWHAAGKPELPTEHSFRHWVGALDWIAREVWGTAPVLDGHTAAIKRIANPGLSWLRQLAFLVVQAGMAGQELQTSKLRDLCRDHDLMPEAVRADCDDAELDRALGRVLGRCFDGRDHIELDGVYVARTKREETNAYRLTRDVKFYAFTLQGVPPPPTP